MGTRLFRISGISLIAVALCLLAGTAARADDCATLRARREVLQSKLKQVSDEKNELRQAGSLVHGKIDQEIDTRITELAIVNIQIQALDCDKVQKTATDPDANLPDETRDYLRRLKQSDPGGYIEFRKRNNMPPDPSVTATPNSTAPAQSPTASTTITNTPTALPPTQFVPDPSASSTPSDVTTSSGSTDSTTSTNLAPSDNTSPSKAPAPLPPVPFGGLGSPSTSYSPAQSANLPADWCVVERTITVIPGQTTKNYSAVRCDDAAGLGADWKVVDKGLTFPQANQIRDGFNGAPGNLPRVWCVMRNGAQNTVIRCDNTAGAGPGWVLIANGLTLPAANQTAFGSPSASPSALPPTTVVNTPSSTPPAPLPPAVVTPTPTSTPPASGCAGKRYACTYMALDPHGASSSFAYEMDVCVPASGNWSQASCTIDATRMDHVYAGATGPDSRNSCNGPSRTSLYHDQQSFESWCKSQTNGRVLNTEPTRHANAAPAALPPIAPAVNSFVNAAPQKHADAPLPPKPHEPQTNRCAQPSGTVRAEDKGTVDYEMVVGVNSQCTSRWVPHPGDTLTLSLGSRAAHGSVTIQGTTVLYKPNRDYKGDDTFVILLRWNNSTGHHSGKSSYTVTVN